jgi:dTDP-4-dehydrorhamnose reductase
MDSRDAVLVVGAGGLIGRSLVTRLGTEGRHVIVTSRRDEPGTCRLDLSADLSSWTPPQPVAVAYLCAATTSLEQCRVHPRESYAVNVTGTMALARTLSRQGTLVVFLSTNLVFDGSVPYQRAESATCPRTEYGQQKAEVERQLLDLPGGCVVRLTKVLGPEMPLLRQWTDLLRQSEVIRPFLDMVMAPVSVRWVVDVLCRIGQRRIKGLWQVSGSRDVTYAEAAGHLASRLQASPSLVQPRMVADAGLSLEHVPTHTTLDCSRIATELGIEPPDPWEAIDQACP